MAFSKAMVRLIGQVRARYRGEPVDTPAMPAEAPTGGGFNLKHLRDFWEKQQNPRKKTRIEAASIVRRFVEVN